MNKKSILFSLKEIDLLLTREAMTHTKMSERAPLSLVQARIISYLLEHKNEKVYQRDLEKFLGLRRSTISGVLQTMEKNNIINKIEVQEDARVKQVIFTEKAAKREREIQKCLKKIENQLEKNISKADLEIFFKVTDQIKKNLCGGNE